MSRNASANRRQSYREAVEDFRDNPGQLQAYEARGNCVVLAGPGSGKTKMLTVNLLANPTVATDRQRVVLFESALKSAVSRQRQSRIREN